MARGRHRRRSGLRALWSRWCAVDAPPAVRTDLVLLRAEVERLRALAEASAATAAAALVRAAQADDVARAASARAAAAERELTALRRDVADLREQLVWAFAEGRLPVDAPSVDAAPVGEDASLVVDLRDGSFRTA